MNQILITKDCNINSFEHLYDFKLPILKKERKYLFIFLLSLIFSFILSFFFLHSIFTRLNHSNQTFLLKEKYAISTLYNTNTNSNIFKLSNNISIIGLIDIPQINISYPILSTTNEDLLKISVCRFSGPLPNRVGNLCIAGHNYHNSLMFSNLNKLSIGETIYISDLNNLKLEYTIYDKFIVNEKDLDCTTNSNIVELTLITCHTTNNKERIIIKAKVKE